MAKYFARPTNGLDNGMDNPIAILGLVAAFVWAVIALTTFWMGEYLIAGISFLLLSFSIYVWEVKKDG